MVSQMKKFHGSVCHFSSISRFDIDLFFFPASLQVFATIFTCIFGGILGEYLGRKTVCSIGSPIFLASFLCVTFAPSMHLLFFGQVIFIKNTSYVKIAISLPPGLHSKPTINSFILTTFYPKHKSVGR